MVDLVEAQMVMYEANVIYGIGFVKVLPWNLCLR